MAVALKKTEIDAAIAASGIPAADAAGIWPAARAARDGAPSGTPEATRRNLAVAAAIAEVATKTPALVPAFTTALTAPAAPAPAPAAAATPAPAAPAPAPVPVPPHYADAVDRALRAAGVPEANRPAAASEFATAISVGLSEEEALTRLFEGRGLSDEAIARGKARFHGLKAPKVLWWKRGWKQAKSMLSSWPGRIQLALLVLAGAIILLGPVPSKIFTLLLLAILVIGNLWVNNRGRSIATNAVFILFLIAVMNGWLSGLFGGDTYNVHYSRGVGDSTPVSTIPPEEGS